MGFFKKKKEMDDGYYQGPGWAKLSSIVCARCGCDLHLIRNDQITTINGKQYCDVCTEYFKKLSSAPKHFCVACNRIFPAPEMTSICGNRICKECATKYWAGKLPGLRFTPTNKSSNNTASAGRKTPQPVKKSIPVNVVCAKCGISMTNDGSVRHMGEKYYCKACYDKMAEKLVLMRTGKQEKEIKQELVNVLNAVHSKRVRIQREEEIKRIKAKQEEERKKLEIERLYHTKCFSCGVEHPKSAFHMVDDKYYCEECFNRLFTLDNEGDIDMGLFDKFKKKSTGTEVSAVSVKQFDSDAFAKNHKAVIASHLPQAIEDMDTQKKLLENLNQVLPMGIMELLIHELSSRKAAVEAGALNKNVAIGMNAQKVDGMLKVFNMDVLASKLSSNSDDQLINAYILLDFYAYVLKPEASEGIRKARAYIGLELEKRLPKDAPSNPATTNQCNANNSGKYAEGIDYVLQYRPNDDIYFIEIHDCTGKYLADTATFPGMMGYAAFVLTEDEYNLKVLQNDDAKMNELVGKLLVNLPKDRIIATGCINLATHERRENLHIELKNETMDEGAYQKYRNKRAISYIKSLEKVYITFMQATGDQIPSVDGFGYAWLFSKKEYADLIIQKNPGVNMFYREYDREGLTAFVKTWYRFGISRFKLNPGTNDRFAEVDRDDFLPIDGIKKWNLIGSSLNQLIIRFKQNNAIQNNPMAHATAMTMWSSICHELYRSVFLVPITYDDEPYSVEDWVIHTSLAGAERLTQAEIERQIDDRMNDGSKLIAKDNDGNPIYMLKENLIYGSEKYHFARDGEVTPGKIMHLRTLINNGTTFLCGFTDFEALHKVFGENVRVAVQSYEEIIAHMNDAVSDSTAIQGFVINPGTNELMLSRENIEYAAKEKDEPGKIYTADEKKEN